MQTNFIKRTVIGSAVTFALMGASFVANAAPLFEPWPGPAGQTFTSGPGIDPGKAGGKVWEFTSFDFSGIDHLYYGLNPSAPTQLRLDNPTGPANVFLPGNTMTISSLSIAGPVSTATWTGTSTLVHAPSGTPFSVATRFTATVTDTGGAGTGFVLSGDVGISPIDPAVNAVVEVLGDFTYHRIVEFLNPLTGTFQPYLDAFDAFPTPFDDRTAFSQGHGFYVEYAEAVPAPGALLILGFGLVGLAGARRKAA